MPVRGCTEPTAIALCAAKARAILGNIPERVEVEASGNIIKNAKSVIVPNTGGKKGMDAAAAIGIVAGQDQLGLEVLRDVTKKQRLEFLDYLNKTKISVKQADSELLLDILVRVYDKDSYAIVRIANTHTNFVYMEKNGKVLLEKEVQQEERDSLNYDLLSVQGIFDFAGIVRLNEVQALLDRQIQYNTAISEEGLCRDYGANIGSVLLSTNCDDTKTRAKARAAAGSDARMGGCGLPVVINSGSGNQGMTVSLPVIEYAESLQSSKEQLYRALVLSNMIAIHLKAGIGYLSAYCGAVSAGAAAGAAIAYLRGGSYDAVAHTIVNALAITSGIVCDGAKPSCAAKIATAVDAGILGHDMYLQGQQFYGGDGLLSEGVENTIRNIGRLGREGMRETDKEILCIMTCVD